MRLLHRLLLVLAFFALVAGAWTNNLFAAVEPDDFTFTGTDPINTAKWNVLGEEDPFGQIVTTTQNNRLEFYRNLPAGIHGDADVMFESKGTYDLNSNFHVFVDYHNSVASEYKSGVGSTIWLNMDQGDKYGFDIAARSGWRSDSATSPIYYSSARWDGNDRLDYLTEDRVVTDGVLDAFYNTTSDVLTMSALYKNNNGTYVSAFSRTFVGLRTTYGLVSLAPSLEANFDTGSAPKSGQLYFDNFNIAKPVSASPEPVSCLLFGLGGAAMALRRKKRIKSQ